MGNKQLTRFVLHKSDKPIDDFIKEAEKATGFLLIDADLAKKELAKNWGWITTSGLITFLVGCSASVAPTFATGIAYDSIILSAGAASLIYIAGAFFRENEHKAKSELSGVGYGLLAYYLANHPRIITLSMAAILGAEGVFEIGLSARNKEMEERLWNF